MASSALVTLPSVSGFWLLRFLFFVFYFLFFVFCFLFFVFCFLFFVVFRCFLFSVFCFLFSVFCFLSRIPKRGNIRIFLFFVFCFLFFVFYFCFALLLLLPLSLLITAALSCPTKCSWCRSSSAWRLLQLRDQSRRTSDINTPSISLLLVET